MSKSRIPDSERATRGTPDLTGEKVRFLGLSLSGGKADKACLAVVDYFPKYKKVFLTKLVEKIKNEEMVSADLKICQLVEEFKAGTHSLAFDVPWEMPGCLRSQCRCPGYENCKEPHVRWMWAHFQRVNKKKRPKRIFTPYTQRCVEMYVATELEEPFILNSAMGSNTAPLLARAAFLRRRLSVKTIEVSPKISLWRIGRSLNIVKSHLRFHRHAVGGDQSRKVILENLSAQGLAFLYAEDQKQMVVNNHAFEAFLCAFTAFLKYREQTEPRPEGFPDNEDWIDFPVKQIRWKEL